MHESGSTRLTTSLTLVGKFQFRSCIKEGLEPVACCSMAEARLFVGVDLEQPNQTSAVQFSVGVDRGQPNRQHAYASSQAEPS